MPEQNDIQNDIDSLRARFSDTQALYREACAILFFRYGITPTANKLYQYVKKGSMSAPAEALAKFWAELREKSRTRIEHPDIPEELRATTGELISSLWMQAQCAAVRSLTTLQQEAAEATERAREAFAAAEAIKDKAHQELQQAQAQIQAATERANGLERELAAESAKSSMLKVQIDQYEQARAAADAALIEARKEFTAELDKLREAVALTEKRCRDAEKRALLEIDKERTHAQRLSKELVVANSRQKDLEKALRQATEQHLCEIGTLRQQLGISEGSAQELRARNQALQLELKAETSRANPKQPKFKQRLNKIRTS